jgi:thiol-disulfide isomerase/thioredoxin
MKKIYSVSHVQPSQAVSAVLNLIPAILSTRLIFFALLFCIVGTIPLASAKTPGEVETGQTLREAMLQGLNGPGRKLSEFRGKPLIINVWASWCGPCREEMASLERLSWLNTTGQFSLIGISTDDYPENAKALLKKSNATINHFIDNHLQMENMLGAAQLPLTVLVDANGRILYKIYGSRQWDSPEALSLIRKAFNNQKIAPRQ